MSYILGIDTGGTYTDGVIYEVETGKILSKGKALTTRENLAVGIENCLGTLDQEFFSELSQVNLSTTLATNAIVEGRGNKIALLLLGERPKGELPAEYLKDIAGKYDIRGRQVEPLDRTAVLQEADMVKDKVGAIAISGFASVRNNEHELQAKKLIMESTGLPVVCAHEMSSRLGYYDRTVTTALNARLLSVIYELIVAVKQVLESYELHLPLMIVTGGGSLVSEKVALERPIETVLSGPAASISGAIYLAEHRDGLVLDMGGTTTDIALVKDGKVKMDERGASVGGYHLHINAAEIYTYGMGGDSRIYLDRENRLVVGPNKVYPVCRAVDNYPQLFAEMRAVLPEVRRQREQKMLLDGFLVYLQENATDLNTVQKQIMDYLQEGPHTLYSIRGMIGDRFTMLDLQKLEEKGVLMRIAFTPTDLLHVEGKLNLWNRDASAFMCEELAILSGRTKTDFVAYCRSVIENKLAWCCKNSDNCPENPVIGVGAPSHAWLPGMAERLHQDLCLPEHREVANAIGAAVASISESAKGLIRYNSVKDNYMLFLPNGRYEFVKFEESKKFAKEELKKYVSKKAQESGCDDAKLFVTEDKLEAQESFIEYEILVTAEGRSRWIA